MKQLEMVQDKFIDFELETPEGERKRISDFVGQSEYLFIDFWASWCGPCVREIPGLKRCIRNIRIKGWRF